MYITQDFDSVLGVLLVNTYIHLVCFFPKLLCISYEQEKVA